MNTNTLSVVITGSTRGIGKGLASAFLNLGCSVTVSGRSQGSVDKTVAELVTKHDPARILGQPCDVTQFEQVQSLWDTAQSHFGKVDIWINNAGIINLRCNFWELSPEDIESVLDTNLLGVMYGSKVAITGMLGQGFGSLYNMEGLGSDGRKVPGLIPYGTTKSGLHYFTLNLAEETKATPVIVGALSPGMVITDLLTGEYQDRSADWEKAKRIFSILADKVETVTPWLAQQVLQNTKSGARINWLSTPKVIFRFLTAPFYRRNIFDT